MSTNNAYFQVVRVLGASFSELLTATVLLLVLVFNTVFNILDTDGYLSYTIDDIARKSNALDHYQQASVFINSNEYFANGVIFILWAIIGLILFNIILVTVYSEKSIVKITKLLRTGGQDAHEAFEEKSLQLAVRIAGLIGLGVVVIVTASVVLPGILVIGDQLKNFSPMLKIIAVLSVWTVVCLIGHMVIVSLRTVLLRYRLFYSSL